MTAKNKNTTKKSQPMVVKKMVVKNKSQKAAPAKRSRTSSRSAKSLAKVEPVIKPLAVTASELEPAAENSGLKILNIQTKPTESRTKQSPYLVNLRNPSQNFFEPSISVAGDKSKSTKRPPIYVKPPRDLPLRSKNVQVDFIPEKNSFFQLSLVNLFGFLFKPFKHPHSKIRINSNKQLPKQKPISPVQLGTNEEIEDIFAPPPKARFFIFSAGQLKAAFAFVIVALVLVLPLEAFTYYQHLQETKDKVLLLSNEALDSLQLAQSAATNLDLSSASLQFTQARQNFALAKKEINDINDLTIQVLRLIPSQNKPVQAGLALINAGELFAEVGEILSSAGNDFFNKQDNDYYQSLAALDAKLQMAVVKFNQAKENILLVQANDLPAEHRSTFEKVKTSLPDIEKELTNIISLNTALLKILGHEQWQRYLVMFANNNELRGSGGFLGSFALLDIDRGKIKKMDIPAGGTYDIQGQLVPRVISPEPLHLINPRWEFQDSNWWPDFPTTAKKIQWFYTNADGPSTDGVILMTASLMSQLLAALGPIEMDKYNLTVSSDNFIEETQAVIKAERENQSNTPKQFIADLGPEILEKIFSVKSDKFLELISILQQGLNENQLLLYFNDVEIEKIVLALDWGGAIKQTEGDYLLIVHTNLAGGKTDEVINDKIEHQAEVLDDGSVIDTVKLTRIHTGPNDGNLFTGVQNNSYIRFYVPGGSTLIEVNGFAKPDDKYFEEPGKDLSVDLDLISIEKNKYFDESSGTDVYWENGKTVFGNWLSIKPGETKEVTIKYRLPFKLAIDDSLTGAQQGNTFYYSLLAQKQSGTLGSQLISHLKLNDKLKSMAKFPNDLVQKETEIIFENFLKTNQFYSVVLGAK